jgi:peptidoglycan/LPS O-acetylase OafA/YrhL
VIFLFAFLTFVAFITMLIGGASVAMGSINKDRGWVVFGLKVLLIAILAFIASCIFLWPHLKALWSRS